MQKLHKPKDWRWLLHRALSIVFSRTVVTVVLVLAQAVWLFSVFYWLSDYSHLISRVGLAVSALMCLALVRKDSTAPEFKISWMILFMLMPVQGGLLYLMWGNKRPAIPLRRRMERAEAELAPLRTGDPAARAELARRDPRLAETADYLQNYAASPVFGGTAVRYYPVGDVMLPDMLADLQAAQHSIFVESFIIGMGEMWGQIHDELRKIFSHTQDAKAHGYKAGDFSYNTGKLRCPVCDGTGVISLDVQFLPDVEIPCPACHGSRYAREADDVKLIDKHGRTTTLPRLMDCDVHTALDLCKDRKLVRQRLQVLQDLGLGYLTLGEETPSLSGGEAQRLKLASEMERTQSHAVFVFDEPTIGLHPLDVQTLLGVFRTLIDNGATVIVIEHDLDVIRSADYIVDMGPGGGEKGGRVVAAGTPAQIKATPESVTGRFL